MKSRANPRRRSYPQREPYHGLGTGDGADFSEEGVRRRIRLWRVWDPRLRILITVLTNPSKAGAEDDDPTSARTVERAKRMGYGGVLMLNLMDVIETDSTKISKLTTVKLCCTDSIRALIDAVNTAKRGDADIVCGWGKVGEKYGKPRWFKGLARELEVPLYCLGVNKDGSPIHPLYEPYSREFKILVGVKANA